MAAWKLPTCRQVKRRSIFGCELWHLIGSNVDTFCTAWRSGLKRVWNLPNATHSDLLHMISNDLAIFDELCRRSLMFIDKCFFHSSDLVQFVVRYGDLFGRYKSVIGSNFHFCAALFKFSQSGFSGLCQC